MKSIDTYWYSINPVAILLWPVSLVFRLLVGFRRLAFKTGFFKSKQLKKPVIVIGNIVVGGSGKTPLIIELCKLLISWGIKPGIISRGYGGSGPWPQQLNSKSTPTVVGDEPVQLFHRAAVPVVVGADRVEAGEYLIENNSVDIILSDDGLQHYRLQRDIELIVTDKKRMFGNDLMLPAGPLREPRSRIKNHAWCLYNGNDAGDTDGDGNYYFDIVPVFIENLVTGQRLKIEDFKQSFVHAVAGIGNPERFFEMLQALGINTVDHAFEDHHVYTETDLLFDDSLPILMTEKDSVKCSHFQNKKCWFVSIDIQLSEKFINDFKQQITEILHG